MIEVAFGNEEEVNLVIDKLLDEKLVSSCQVVTSNSKWNWHGKREQALEYLLFMKTKMELKYKIYEIIKSIHSYDCFEFAVFPLSSCNLDYLKWIDEETI